MEIKVGEFYKTRGGLKAKVVYELNDKNNGDAFLVVVTYEDGGERVIHVRDNGQYYLHNQDLNDLVAPWPKKVKVEGWVNVYPDGAASLWHSKEQADAYAQPARIARKRIEFEVEEGDGL